MNMSSWDIYCGYDRSRIGVYVLVKRMATAQTDFHLQFDVVSQFEKPEFIRADTGTGFFGYTVAWITKANTLLREPVLHNTLNTWVKLKERIKTFRLFKVKCLFSKTARYKASPRVAFVSKRASGS